MNDEDHKYSTGNMHGDFEKKTKNKKKQKLIKNKNQVAKSSRAKVLDGSNSTGPHGCVPFRAQRLLWIRQVYERGFISVQRDLVFPRLSLKSLWLVGVLMVWREATGRSGLLSLPNWSCFGDESPAINGLRPKRGRLKIVLKLWLGRLLIDGGARQGKGVRRSDVQCSHGLVDRLDMPQRLDLASKGCTARVSELNQFCGSVPIVVWWCWQWLWRWYGCVEEICLGSGSNRVCGLWFGSFWVVYVIDAWIFW